ncbi:MAG TPA: alanyl-tRNA editing protein [Sedimentisphaerales bacterium]|nr:alanyl-tRNA editing protein [Sedimentisphaerales bacterium]HRS10937.1 alanyl-tRNA editing protein [Sedimentisphaerales bacterium]HRV48631.1 alanyl-tRNA editing protein [Sedimentisphaerales bacterium]
MKRLYWTQPDTLEAEVVVTALDDSRVATDPVLFHPDEGGQPPDTGTIGEANVLGVEVVAGQIVHRLDRPLSDGRYVARVDRLRREHTASHHTAQHIISGIAQQRFGLKTTGVHIGLERCTVDFDRRVEWETVMTLEREVMDVVTLDVPVETLFDQADVRVRDELKPIEADVIRVVKIGGWDQSACCGAHVRTTGRIGMVRLCDIESKKDGTRLFFLAGRKALEYSQQETNILRELRKAASCSTVELLATFEKAQAQARDLTKEIARLWTQMLPGLAASAQVLEVQSSKVGVQVAEIPPQLVAKLAGLIAEATEGVGIAVSGTRIAITSRTLDAAALLKTIQNTTGGKGGGSPGAASGNLGRTVGAEEILTLLKS